MIFEAALFDRYGGKTWTACLLACGKLDRYHIAAVNREVALRIREGENREMDTEDQDRPVDERRRRPQPQPVLDQRTDWWGGHTDDRTGRPAILRNCAMHAYTSVHQRLEEGPNRTCTTQTR